MGALSAAKSRNTMAVAIILIALATTAVIIRVILRKTKKIAFAADDYFIIGALFFTYGLLGLQIASMTSNGAPWIAPFLIRVGVVDAGVGRHASEVKPAQVVLALKLMLPIETLYGISMSTVKCSILLFYLRIFVNRSFRIAARVCIVISVCWGMSVILEGFLLCRPLALNWDPTIKGTCGDRHSAFVAAGALNMITDIMVLLLPIPTVWNLQMPRANKVALCAVFALGLFTCVTSIIRLNALNALTFEDITYTLADALMWTTIEPSIGIINACLPMMRPLLIKLLPAGLFIKRSKNTGVTGSKRFERLDEHAYPLTRVEGVMLNEITSHGDSKLPYEATHSLSDVDSQRHDRGGGSHGGINIKTEWQVQHSGV